MTYNLQTKKSDEYMSFKNDFRFYLRFSGFTTRTYEYNTCKFILKVRMRNLFQKSHKSKVRYVL
ncbi:hypothetical protein BWD13_00050 [Leptospira santarosai serovar Grippotyphosa]|nr:hypothetical protein BWD13_00050 [Leptospira santarosai serovar Grippotyphosa]